MYSRMIASLGVVASLVLAACGATEKPAADGTLTLTISNPANVSNVPLHIAMDKGFFAAEGLTIILTRGGPFGSTEVVGTLSYRIAFERPDLGYAAAMGITLVALILTVAVVLNKVLKREPLEY